MIKSLKGRMFAIVAIVAICGGYIYNNGITLGLDLQGGMHLALEVDDPEGTMTPEAKAGHIENAERILRTRIDQFGVAEPLIQRQGAERIVVQLPGISDEERAKELIQQSAFLEFKLVVPTSQLEGALQRLDRQIVASLGVDSLQALGRATQAAAQGGQDDVSAALFGGADSTAAEEDPAEAADQEAVEDEGPNFRPFTGLLTTGDVEGTYLVSTEDVAAAELFMSLPQFQAALPRNVSLAFSEELLPVGGRTYQRLYVLEDEAFITGDLLDEAVAQRDPQFNQAQVNFQWNRAGGRRFADFTAQNIGNHIAILLDGQVMSAPVVNDRIGASGVIEMGNSDMAEAADLALVLRAGALPAPLKIEEERTVGPSLGQDSIEAGELAGMVGLVLVFVVMVGYYKVAGVLAIGALSVYLLLVLGGLAAIGATLTLPGLAGLVLSVGMAVDANVLIFERIREELIHGRATRTAVDEGFAHALSAIVDANLTTLITALILFNFGTGPVQGFAVTLSIGIVASFFSAIYVTRTFFLLYLHGKKASDPISI